jgi:predicted molibdopterin-dependent oxidoreductase YjgC
MDYNSASSIMDEIASLTPIYAGISHKRLKNSGIQWPCPNKEHPGTKILHTEKFTRGLGKFIPVEYKQPAEIPDSEFPFILTTGRILYHYHTGTMTRRVSGLNQIVSHCFVEINKEDAENLKIEDGERVKIKTRRGEIETIAKVREDIKRGIIFIPFHFAEEAANILTNPEIDPLAKIPELKVCAARIEKI